MIIFATELNNYLREQFCLSHSTVHQIYNEITKNLGKTTIYVAILVSRIADTNLMYGSKEFVRVAKGCKEELYIYGPGLDPFKLMQYFLISNFGLLGLSNFT